MKVKVSKEYEEAAAEVRKTDAYKRARVISDFTERICRRLEELGITQSEFARRLGVTRAYVTNFLRGNVNFTADEKGTYAFEVEVCGFFSADPALFFAEFAK